MSEYPFILTYDPEPSGRFKDIRQGYWYCYAEPGYDGDGLTPLDAMATTIVHMSKALVEKEKKDKKKFDNATKHAKDIVDELSEEKREEIKKRFDDAYKHAEDIVEGRRDPLDG